MQATNEEQDCEWQAAASGSSAIIATEPESHDTRVEFRHASGHLGEKRPGFYLILLRNEIRHRSLRDKPTLTV